MRPRTDRLRVLTGVSTDPTIPLWRASQVFRFITLAYALTYQISVDQNYEQRELSWAILAFMLVWSGVAGVALTGGYVPRWRFVLADQVVVIVLMISSRIIAEPEWYTNNQTVPTTLWVTNAVLSAAILGGPWIGLVSACVLAGVSLGVQDRFDIQLWRDATAPMMISAGIAIGMASRTAIRAHAQLERAVRLAAATEERERLARHVHDGVLQVLAYVRRRGEEVGGEAAEIARMAGEQEVALRTLMSEGGAGSDADSGGSTVDLCPLLRTQARTDVVVSTPGEPVFVARWVGSEIAAAVENALSNTERHAGPDAKAYVLVEDLPDCVIVTVRDDGVGIPSGRLAEAEAEGRMGVSHSIRGRIESLGGTAALITEEGGGVEWELRIPKPIS